MTDKVQKRVYRVGTRKSQLALIQTNGFVNSLKRKFPELQFEIKEMSTMGDNILDVALSKIGEKSLFTKELENALIDESVDFVVHSLKDLPTILPEGMVVGAVCERDDARDALVLHKRHREANFTLATLPEGSVIGTSSLRRAAQIRRRFPQLKLADIRGNLNTRLRKLDDKLDFDAIVLATAGLERMGWQHRISTILDPVTECLHAVSQGAVAVECRKDDEDTLDLLHNLHDYPTLVQIIAERGFLRELEGGCSVPVGVHTRFEKGVLTMTGAVFSIDGQQEVIDTLTVEICDDCEPQSKKKQTDVEFCCVVAKHFDQPSLEKSQRLGIDLAARLISKGAAKILAKAKSDTAAEILAEKAAKLKAKTAAAAVVVTERVTHVNGVAA